MIFQENLFKRTQVEWRAGWQQKYKEHKNDVFRLAQLITANTRQVLSSEIAEDMKKFLSEIADETVDLKSLGIRGTDKKRMTDMLYQCYGLKANT